MNLTLNPIEIFIITAVIQALAKMFKSKIPQNYIAGAVLLVAIITECIIGLIHGGITLGGIALAIGTSGVNSQIFKIVNDNITPTA